MSKDLTTGLTIRQGEIEWTTIRKARGSYSVVASKSVPLDAEGATGRDLTSVPEADRPALSAEIRTKCAGIEGQVSVGLCSEYVLMRVVELPTVDAGELKDMAVLQVDKFSPFPAESTTTSHEVLHQTETSSRVLVAALQRKAVDSIGTVLTNARIFPQRLDVEVLCWLRLLVDAGEIAQTGCQITVLRDITACDVIVTHNGLPLVFRSLGRTANLSDEDLCSELDYTLTALEAEHGISEMASLSLWHWNDEPSEMVSLLRERLPVEIRTKPFSSLPPISEGLARRSLDADRAALNLAPPEWHTGERAVRIRKNLVLASGILLGVWLACVSALFGGTHLQKKHLAGREAVLAGLEKPAGRARELRSLLLMAEQYTNRTCSALECLREVTTLKPPEIQFFKSFKYDNNKGKSVIVQGEASTANAVLDFETALRKSTLFTVDDMDGPKTISEGVIGFTITLSLPAGEK